MSDIQLRRDVLDELEYEPRVNAAHIGVTADDGVVTLGGHVRNYAEEVHALEAVRRVRDVKGIADEIKVNSPFEVKHADDDIAKRALDFLRWDTLVPSDAIQVTVVDGWITLSGGVDWYYQKIIAEEDVQKLDGVVGVTNNIMIKPHPQVGDLQRKIEDAFKRQADVEAKAIKVTVKGDRVILEGKVASRDERRAAIDAVWAAPGVQAVEDHLSIGSH